MIWRTLLSLYRLSFPGGFVVVGLWLLIERWGTQEALDQLARIVPYAVFAVAFVLAWWFRQQRLTVTILLFALAERGLVLVPQLDLAGPSSSFSSAVVALLGLNLLWIPFVRSRGRLNWRSSSPVVLLLIEGVVFALLLSSAARQAQQRLAEWLELLPWSPQVCGLVLLGLAAVVALERALTVGSAAERGLFWAAVLGMLASAASGDARDLFFSGVGLVLLLAILEGSFQMAYEDELTALPSRRSMNEALAELGEIYTLALVDIDHFKNVNDRHGHEVGDQVLGAVAAQLRRVGGGGRGFRYGGEEFALIFAGQRLADVLGHLEALRKNIASSRFGLREPGRPRRKPKKSTRKRRRPRSISVTVSIGVAQPSARYRDPASVLKAADRALYRAKRGGRNQVRR